MKDRLFREEPPAGKFRFDERVAEVFDDMLSRSVPFYKDVQKMVSGLAADFYRPGTAVYDLGCSTGTTIVSLCKVIDDPALKITGIDSSEPVIGRARAKVSGYGLDKMVELRCADIMDVDISNASVVIMNYTLQFIPPEQRLPLLKKIHNGLVQGGILLLSEKVLEEDGALSDVFIEKYHDFKREMGYSDLEISKKRESLEEVLIPFTVKGEMELLQSAGFDKASIFFKWFNFTSFVAVK